MIIDKIKSLESRFGQWSIPNLAIYIIGIQAIVYALIVGGLVDYQSLFLIPSKILIDGEYGRLFTFFFIPPTIPNSIFGAFFLFIFWYVFFMISGALEAFWGTFLFNVYIFLCIAFTALCAFVGFWISKDIGAYVQPEILFMSLFLAFAMIRPNMEFLLFFIVPVKVKYLAMLSLAFFVLSLILSPSLGAQIILLGQILNFILFFSGSILENFKNRKRLKEHQARSDAHKEKPMHTCSICGVTDKTNKDLEFRYRSENNQLLCVCSNCKA
jgi:hypothetical protein